MILLWVAVLEDRLLGSVLSAVGLSLQVLGTLFISFDALGSQGETRHAVSLYSETVELLSFVTSSESNKGFYVSKGDISQEVMTVLARIVGPKPEKGETFQEATQKYDQLQENMKILDEAEEIAFRKNREMLDDRLSKSKQNLESIDTKSKRRLPLIVAAIVLVFAGGLLELIGTHVLGG